MKRNHKVSQFIILVVALSFAGPSSIVFADGRVAVSAQTRTQHLPKVGQRLGLSRTQFTTPDGKTHTAYSRNAKIAIGTGLVAAGATGVLAGPAIVGAAAYGAGFAVGSGVVAAKAVGAAGVVAGQAIGSAGSAVAGATAKVLASDIKVGHVALGALGVWGLHKLSHQKQAKAEAAKPAEVVASATPVATEAPAKTGRFAGVKAMVSRLNPARVVNRANIRKAGSAINPIRFLKRTQRAETKQAVSEATLAKNIDRQMENIKYNPAAETAFAAEMRRAEAAGEPVMRAEDTMFAQQMKVEQKAQNGRTRYLSQDKMASRTQLLGQKTTTRFTVAELKGLGIKAKDMKNGRVQILGSYNFDYQARD